jgi:cytochrome P450
MGGKRVCLGKTFAEITVRFTVPMLFHYFDFEFVNPLEQSANKVFYTLGGQVEPNYPMNLIHKNKAE